VFIVVVVYFVTDSVRKLLDTLTKTLEKKLQSAFEINASHGSYRKRKLCQ
jgi:hypothetical protein